MVADSNDEEDAGPWEQLDDVKERKPPVVRSIFDERRTHVIGVDPNSSPHLVWCETVLVQSHPEVRQWYCCLKSAEVRMCFAG